MLPIQGTESCIASVIPNQNNNVEQNRFFSSVRSPLPLVELIDHLPATYFFAKDRQGRFVYVNRALLEVLGISKEIDVSGKTDAHLFMPEVAERYRHQDQQRTQVLQPFYRRGLRYVQQR